MCHDRNSSMELQLNHLFYDDYKVHIEKKYGGSFKDLKTMEVKSDNTKQKTECTRGQIFKRRK